MNMLEEEYANIRRLVGQSAERRNLAGQTAAGATQLNDAAEPVKDPKNPLPDLDDNCGVPKSVDDKNVGNAHPKGKAEYKPWRW